MVDKQPKHCKQKASTEFLREAVWSCLKDIKTDLQIKEIYVRDHTVVPQRDGKIVWRLVGLHGEARPAAGQAW